GGARHGVRLVARDLHQGAIDCDGGQPMLAAIRRDCTLRRRTERVGGCASHREEHKNECETNPHGGTLIREPHQGVLKLEPRALPQQAAAVLSRPDICGMVNEYRTTKKAKIWKRCGPGPTPSFCLRFRALPPPPRRRTP